VLPENDGGYVIATEVFEGCNLGGLTIPSCVTSIGKYAFSNCTNLTTVTSLVPAEKLFAIGRSVFSGVDKDSCTLFVPYGAKATYASNYGWRVFKCIVENTTDNLCGDNTYWTYDEATATHSIIGWGTMYDYACDNVPWTKYKEGVKTVVFSLGIVVDIYLILSYKLLLLV
jgi:hypothetical protein